MIRLAVDNQISHLTIKKLEKEFEVVMMAENMPDEIWIEKALDKGATIFISPDLDIPLYLEKNYEELGLIWIDIPQSMKGSDQYKYISNKIKKIKSKGA